MFFFQSIQLIFIILYQKYVFNKKEEISLKSLLTSEFVESILQDYNLSMISKGLESTRFILKLERVQ